MLQIGVIGYGYWGPNLVRNFMESSKTKVSMVADMSLNRLATINPLYPSIITTTDYKEILSSPDVDAVAIATPVSTHFEIALQALKAGKHVLVEKPITNSSANALQLIEEAERRNLVLMVDHTFPYTGAVRKIKDLIDKDELGQIYYYQSTRVNLGLFQHDVSVIWDLAVHDLSIIEYILTAKPIAVSATGLNHVAGQPENIAYLTLFFKEDIIAHIHVNWLAPVKVRQTLIGGSKKMIVYDDLEPTEKIKIYDKGITLNNDPNNIHEMKVGYRTGDMWCPKIEGTEALRNLVSHFVNCVETGEKPITSAESGLRVVKAMEAATESIAKRGQPVELK